MEKVESFFQGLGSPLNNKSGKTGNGTMEGDKEDGWALPIYPCLLILPPNRQRLRQEGGVHLLGTSGSNHGLQRRIVPGRTARKTASEGRP